MAEKKTPAKKASGPAKPVAARKTKVKAAATHADESPKREASAKEAVASVAPKAQNRFSAARKRTTYMVKAQDVAREWHLVDLDGLVLGRAASRIAHILRGKHKATYTPHADAGDYVVVVNAEKVKLT